MKKLLGILLSVVMVVMAIAPLTVVGANDTTPATVSDRTVYFEYDFNDPNQWLFVNTSAGATDSNGASYLSQSAGGFWLNGSAAACSTANGYLEFTSSHNNFLDLQIWNVGIRPQNDFILSFEYMPLVANVSAKMGFTGRNGSTNAGFEDDAKIATIASGRAKANNAWYGSFPIGEWTLVELAFNFDEATSKFTSYDYIVNGEKLATVSFGSGYDYIFLLRLFRYTGGKRFAIDNLKMASGMESYYDYTQNRVIYHNDFTNATIENQNTANNARVVNDYVYPLNAYKNTTTAENGAINFISDGTANAMADIQMWNNTIATGRNKLVGDANVTFKIRPIGGDWNSADDNFMAFRDKSLDFKRVFYTKDGSIAIKADGGDKFSAKLSKTLYTTVELVFDYNEAGKYYQAVTLYVNGENVGTASIGTDTTLINHFRLFCFAGKDKGMSLDEAKMTVAENIGSLYEAPGKTEFVGYQATAADADNTFDVRLVAVLTEKDIEAYEKVGFKVEVSWGDTVKTKDVEVKTVYEKLIASADKYAEYTAGELYGAYIFALDIQNAPSDAGNVTFKVTTYYQLTGEDVVDGETVTFTINPTTDIPTTEVY